MKKIVFTYMYLCLCFCVTKAQMTVDLHTMCEFEGIRRTIPKREIKDTNDGILVTYYFDNIVLQKDPLYPNAKKIIIDGFVPNTSVGLPEVMSRWDTFAVPNSSATVVLNDSSYIELSIELSPARPVLPNSGDEEYTEENVKPITAYLGFFPSSPISAIRDGEYRGQRLLNVCITPTQYDHINRKVRIYTMIQYKIQYDVSTLKDGLSKFYNTRKSEDTFLKNIALNIPSSMNSPKTIVSSADTVRNKYLIISVPKYAMAVYRFAEWKKTIGFDVQIAMQESWDVTLVKNTIRNACVPDTIDYLLIIGGQNDVPGEFSNLYHHHYTDLYYGCLNTDYSPDIFRGRLLVNSCDEAMTVVDKIINYESNPVTDDFFYERGVHCAYFQDNNRDSCEDRRFVLTSERIRDSLLTVIDSITRIYIAKDSVFPIRWNQNTFAYGDSIPMDLRKPTFKWNGDSVDIKNCVNQKTLYILLRDHGKVDKWLEPLYTKDYIQNLDNGNYLPVVFSICCHTGKFEESDCFCECFLKKKNGGCVAIYGATQASFSGPNDVMAEGMFNAIWPSLGLYPTFPNIGNPIYSYTPLPTYRLGPILDIGLKRVDEAYTNTNDSLYSRYTAELFHCFGDPSMMIYTEKPNTFSSASIDRQNNGLISVNTGGVLATISFYNRRTGEVNAYKGYSVTNPGDSETSVCISAHNMIPLLDEAVLYIQNQTLTDGGYYGGVKTIKVGKNVTTTQSQGDVNFSQGNYLLMGKRIELHPGCKISIGASLKTKN